MSIQLRRPQSDSDWSQARRLIEDYADSLHLDLSFQDFGRELEHLSREYAPPSGAFLLASEDGVTLGGVGVRQFAAGIGEIKRLYVIPAARGLGVGRLLAQGIVSVSRELGFVRLLLDTLPSMTEAHALYESLGFRPTRAYRFNPVPGTSFLELDLA